MANRCIDKVSIDVDAFRGLLKRNNMYVTGKNGLDLVLDREAKTIRRWLEAGEIPVSMIDDICNALKCKKEEFIMETDKKWYIFEGCAEGDRADMALLSEEEYEVIKRFFENKISFYDERYAGEYYPLKSLGAFESKEDAVNAYMNKHCYSDPDDLVGEFKDMYMEEEE